MATVSTVSKPGYIYDANTDTWYPIGVGSHTHSDAIPASANVFAGKNGIINGAFNNWQRGTSIAGSGASLAACYTTDRWRTYRAGLAAGVTTSRQTSTVAGIRYGARVQRDSGNTSTALVHLDYANETAASIPFAGQTITFSFYAKAGANFSSASSALGVNVFYGTGTDQSADAFTGLTSIISSTATLTTSAQRFTFTAAVPSTATEIGCDFTFTPVGTASTNDWFEVTGVQLEVGSTATPFQTASGTIGGELALCQRYYYRTGGDTVYSVYGTGISGSATSASGVIALPVIMRISPTTIDYSTVAVQENMVGGVIAVTNITSSNPSKTLASITLTVASGLTQYRPVLVLANNSTSSYLGFSAEL